MKTLHCSHCHSLVFFENSLCTHCGRLLAFDPRRQLMVAFDADASPPAPALPEGHSPSSSLQPCQNHAQGVCNWAADAERDGPLCLACAYTRTVPNLDAPQNRSRWARIESAKRAFLYDLIALDLVPPAWADDNESGLAFDFLEDAPDQPILTGHANGLITLNIVEADDVERERRRSELGEPIRSLLGHFRHESGHYFWDRLIRDQDRLDAFRQAFGDEREDYQQALQRYHRGERKPDWQTAYLTEYASAHPWEDWAETWAHYLHLRALADTAQACGLRLQPTRDDQPSFPADPNAFATPADALTADWAALSFLANQLNRSLGLHDPYPFVFHPKPLDKIRFVHRLLTPPRSDGDAPA